MLKKILLSIKNYDWWLLASVLLLIIFGCAIIYSVGINSDTSDLSRFYKQIIFAFIGLIIMLIIGFTDYRALNNYSYMLYIIGVLLLVSVLIFGSNIRGTTGWFNFGFVGFQPVEFAKIILVVFLARFFSIKTFAMDKVKNIALSAFLTGIFVTLVIMQPDLGSALIFIGLWLGLLLLSNIKKSQIVILAALLFIICLASWFFVLQDYQKERIQTFINPNNDSLNTGYNVLQSITAVGSGKIFGRGLGLGPQSQLNFLPEQEADFIFAVIAEELGFIGVVLIIFLLCFMFYRIWLMMNKSQDNFTLYMCSGILIILFIQSVINIGMNIGIMPVTGLPLPFISAGGSSLMINLILIGFLQSIYQRQHLT